MWRKFLALLLLSSFAQAQMAQASGCSEQGLQKDLREQCLLQAGTGLVSSETNHSPQTYKQPGTTTQLEMVTPSGAQGASQGLAGVAGFSWPAGGSLSLASFYPRYNHLRRGRDEEIVVVLCEPYRTAHNCPVNSVFSNQSGLEPLTLEMRAPEGFTVRYREGKEFRKQPQGAAVPTEIGLKVFRLKVRADDHLPLGIYTLPGKLTFRTHKAGQLPETQQIDVSIQLTVVEHSAQVIKDDWSLEYHHGNDIGTKIFLGLTAPLWGPFLLAFWAAYEIDGGD
jgi:hypothetical protein